MTISMTRDDLLEKLAEVLKEAQAEDAKVTAKHEAQEINALKLFRAKVRKALDWDYATVKGKNFGVSLEHDFRPDRCPQRQAAPIERMIRDIKLDQRKTDSPSPRRASSTCRVSSPLRARKGAGGFRLRGGVT
jgi:hypothetical protein